MSATSRQNPVTNTVYSLSSYTTTVTFGSSDSDIFSIDTATGRLKQYQFKVGSNSDTGTTSWNPNGTLQHLAITDTVPGTSDTQA